MVPRYIGEIWDRINLKIEELDEFDKPVTLHKLRYHVSIPYVAKQNHICMYWWQGRGCAYFGRGCVGKHPGFEDGYPLWRENLCSTYQIGRSCPTTCSRLHITWKEYLLRDQQSAWTDWMHMAAEYREKQGPGRGVFPVTGPEWFKVDAGQDDLYKWRASPDFKRKEADRDNKPFSTFPPTTSSRTRSNERRKSNARSRTPSTHRTRQKDGRTTSMPPKPAGPAPPQRVVRPTPPAAAISDPPMVKLDLNTNERRNAWKYFRVLARLILNPTRSSRDVPCFSHVDMATMILMDLWLIHPDGRSLLMANIGHALSSPCFFQHSLGWLITLVVRLNRWVHQAAIDKWKDMDLDFSEVIDTTALENSDQD